MDPEDLMDQISYDWLYFVIGWIFLELKDGPNNFCIKSVTHQFIIYYNIFISYYNRNTFIIKELFYSSNFVCASQLTKETSLGTTSLTSYYIINN